MGNMLLRNILKNNGVYYPNIPFIPTNPNSDKVLNATTRTVTQTTNYYPFGLAITTTGTSKNKYLYNGKEIQPSNNFYDYGARMYDASVGRWFVVDPLTKFEYGSYQINEIFGEIKQHPSETPYSYVFNNPVAYFDLFGFDSSKPINIPAVNLPISYKKTENTNPNNNILNFIDFAKTMDNVNYFASNSVALTTGTTGLLEAIFRSNLKNVKPTNSFYKRQLKTLNSSANKLAKIGQRIGVAGVFMNIVYLSNKYLNDGVTKKEAFDLGVNILFLTASASNPIVLGGIVGYGVFDAIGGLDGIKEYFGVTEEVIFKK